MAGFVERETGEELRNLRISEATVLAKTTAYLDKSGEATQFDGDVHSCDIQTVVVVPNEKVAGSNPVSRSMFSGG